MWVGVSSLLDQEPWKLGESLTSPEYLHNMGKMSNSTVSWTLLEEATIQVLPHGIFFKGYATPKPRNIKIFAIHANCMCVCAVCVDLTQI